jgi:6-phosphogluconolactonase/glucosamine-6-phosphate isomerase/deaminase
MDITIVSKQEIPKVAADTVSQLLMKFKNVPVLLLLSGGSSFEMYNYVDTSNLSHKTTIGMLDERYSFEKDVNNFALLEKTEFYKKAEKQKVEFINTFPTMLDPS